MNFKTFVLDTNVLIHNPQSLFSFGNNHVVLPMTVIEELDTLKKFRDDKGQHARIVSRYLDKLRGKGKLVDGVKMDNGGILRVMIEYEAEMPVGIEKTKPDNRILMAALQIQLKGEDVYFITKDIISSDSN